ncbi:MAG: ABC transporter substrate-binding protein [Planctomyces sp.]|nr:ABC transporter substrate-binding protein [Planctomyces sp.]
MASRTGIRWTIASIVAVILAVMIPILRQSSRSANRVVLYCAHDSIFADAVIRKFESATGIDVEVRYDEEASKSLGLTNLLIAEKDQARCDVFWNNQTMGTIRLKAAGVLEPWKSENYGRIPAQFRDADGYWTGFGARMRVFVINTNRMAGTVQAVNDYLQGPTLSEAAIAIPLYGTTLTQYTVMCAELGFESLQQWHADLRSRGIHEARGNGAVKDLVADGVCRLGYTDTDDVFVALRQGKPVTMQPVRLQSGKTIVIPNSVALIRGCPNPGNARTLIDFLLSEEVELMLAASDARQIPLGEVDESRVPAEVRELRQWANDGVDQTLALEYDEKVLNWLSQEYTPQ